jgi:DNA repair protein RecO (recombination protein O)
MSWTGRGELLRLSAVESAAPVIPLPNAVLMAGFYANELLLKLLERSDPHPDLFVHYAALIEGLTSGQDTELLLRGFETELLSEMGYALDLKTDSTDHSPVQSGQFYELQIERGLVPVAGNSDQGLVYSGEQYLAIAQLELTDKEIRRAAKRVLRSALDFYLGGRALRTREVAQAMRR